MGRMNKGSSVLGLGIRILAGACIWGSLACAEEPETLPVAPGEQQGSEILPGVPEGQQGSEVLPGVAEGQSGMEILPVAPGEQQGSEILPGVPEGQPEAVAMPSTSEIYIPDPPRRAVRLTVSDISYENPVNPYDRLKVPAQIVRIGDWYFITDCYHNQVLYTAGMGTAVKDWKVMATDVEQPHGIAGDGQVYLVLDTENDRVLVFEWKKGRFQNTQRLDGMGRRPHYIVYDEPTESFFIWSSLTGEMYIVKKEPESGVMYLAEIRKIKELDGFYVRSFTIMGDQILFPSGNNCYITLADKHTLEVQARFPVTGEVSGMACIIPAGGYFYMTVSSDLNYNQNAATMIRSSNLLLMAQGIYENVYSAFPEKGIPYYINHMNGAYYMTSAGTRHTVWRFQVTDEGIQDVRAIY